MKKALLLMSVAILTACNSSGESKSSKIEKTSEKPTAAVKLMTKADYLQKIHNYEKSPNDFIYEGKLPSIVNFSAAWCGQCRKVAPILDKMAVKYDGKINIYKIDVDTEEELAAVHGIKAIPTMILFPMNGQPQIIRGALPEDQIEAAIQQVLLSK